MSASSKLAPLTSACAEIRPLQIRRRTRKRRARQRRVLKRRLHRMHTRKLRLGQIGQLKARAIQRRPIEVRGLQIRRKPKKARTSKIDPLQIGAGQRRAIRRRRNVPATGEINGRTIRHRQELDHPERHRAPRCCERTPREQRSGRAPGHQQIGLDRDETGIHKIDVAETVHAPFSAPTRTFASSVARCCKRRQLGAAQVGAVEVRAAHARGVRAGVPSVAPPSAGPLKFQLSKSPVSCAPLMVAPLTLPGMRRRVGLAGRELNVVRQYANRAAVIGIEQLLRRDHVGLRRLPIRPPGKQHRSGIPGSDVLSSPGGEEAGRLVA